ncbi:MAG: hypothetical protein L6R37_007664 [Teloschistes peruensis]|nr:MAG: hypothetical protein L6R37_007664 [Teloschistes peruensis]
MSSSICWRCLTDTTLQRPLSRVTARFRPHVFSPAQSFSTTQKAELDRVTRSRLPPEKGAKRFVAKKKRSGAERSRRPAPGERKAFRKRIVLSNVNALDVPGMQEINANNMGDESLRGHVLRLPGTVVDRLRAAEAFKPTQAWGMFSRPGFLMRKETLELARMVRDISSSDENSEKTVRMILVGQKESGKSMLLLQGLTMAFLKGWTVINLPEAQDITIGHTSYAPLPSSPPQTYIQPDYYARLLRQISTANPHLADHQLSHPQTPPSSSSFSSSSTFNTPGIAPLIDRNAKHTLWNTLGGHPGTKLRYDWTGGGGGNKGGYWYTAVFSGKFDKDQEEIYRSSRKRLQTIQLKELSVETGGWDLSEI